eukprot:2641932-Pyramimonas_sp.AAC.1
MRSVQAVCDVPWRPHVGLRIELVGSGAQLFTRLLELAPRPPLVQRPQKQAAEGSKSSLNKQKQAVARQCALEKRNSKIASRFGEALSTDLHAGQREGEEEAP